MGGETAVIDPSRPDGVQTHSNTRRIQSDLADDSSFGNRAERWLSRMRDVKRNEIVLLSDFPLRRPVSTRFTMPKKFQWH